MLTADLETANPAATMTPRWRPADGVLCPFCGVVTAKIGRCPQCTLADNPATRAAAKTRDGFWYVLPNPNIAARGMTFQTLLSLVGRGVVTPESIVRGPGTHQLWRWAGKVKGLSREMGFCYTCGDSLGTTAETCPHCNRAQSLPEVADRPIERNVDHDPAPAPSRPPELAAGTASRPARRSVAGERYVPPQPDPADALPAAEDIEPSRPERAPRRLPREDLLTPIDVAKAFSIPFDFNSPPAPPAAPASRPRIQVSGKSLKTAGAVLLALTAAGGLRSVLTASCTTTAASSTLAWVHERLHHAASHTIEALPAPTQFANAAAPVAPPVASTVAPHVATPVRFVEPPIAAVSAVAPVPAIAAPPVEPAPAPSPADNVQTLWTTALDAESRRDFADAVHNYERIRSLPDNAWPAGLNTRLKLARQELIAGTY